jgi:hypothetical protein
MDARDGGASTGEGRGAAARANAVNYESMHHMLKKFFSNNRD